MMMIQPTIRALAASLLLAAPIAAQGMDPDVDLLDFRVTDAEYSAALDRIVVVSGTPTNAVHVYDPVNQASAMVALPLAGTCISVSPDGQEAVVGHSGWVTHLALSPLAVIQTWPVPANAGDIVHGGNGFAYSFPSDGQWTRIECVDLTSGTVTQHTGFFVRQGTRARLHPSGDWIYGADNGLTPSDIEKYDITAGTATYLYDSPYHGDFSMCGDVWPSQDGFRLFTRCSNAFLATATQADDMTFNGTLSDTNILVTVAHSSSAGKILAIGSSPDTGVDVYDDAFLAFEESVALPQVDVGGMFHDLHGDFLFFDSASDQAFILGEVDAASGLVFNWGVATYGLEVVPSGLMADTTALSVTSGGKQSFTLDAGPDHADQLYLVLGSLAGTSPGIPVGSVIIPLNFDFRYFPLTLSSGASVIQHGTGFLDPAGQVSAAFLLPPGLLGPGYVGTSVHHAVVAFDGAGTLVYASNAVPLTFTP